MPTIQSKKYDTISFLDIKTWNKWVETGRARHFRILDDGDMQETIIGTPEKIIEFADTDRPEPKDEVEEILSREDIKKLLDEKEIPYNSRLGTEKLLNLLNS